jgi:hypothetical protein
MGCPRRKPWISCVHLYAFVSYRRFSPPFQFSLSGAILVYLSQWSQDRLKTPDEERASIYVLPPKCEQRHHPAYASTSEILACELWPVHDLPAAQSERREKEARAAKKGRQTSPLVQKQRGSLILKAMYQGAAAGVGAAIGQAMVHLPDDNQCEVQVGLAGGPVHHPAPNAVQPLVATVSHFQRVSPSPGTEVPGKELRQAGLVNKAVHPGC